MFRLFLFGIGGTVGSALWAQEFSLWGTHGAAISFDSGSGVLTAITGNDPNYHWNKSNWAGRTGLKAFATTAHFNGQTVEAAISSLTWENVSGDSGDAYWNIMVEDAGGHRAILAPRYYGDSALAVNDAGFVTNNTRNWYSVFEAEAGWTGTASTGSGVATWDDIRNLTITSGPFAEFPDTLTGAAEGQGDARYLLSNWADWAAQSGSSGAHLHGVLLTFGQSTGTTPAVTQIGNILVNGIAPTFAENPNRAVAAPTSGPASFTTAESGARTTVALAASVSLDSLTATGGAGDTRVVWSGGATVTLPDGVVAQAGDGAEFTGRGALVGSLEIAAGGLLSGAIAVSGTTTIGDGGVFAPGFSPGASYSGGDLVLADGGTLVFELGGLTAATGTFTNPAPGSFDQLFYGGTISLDAGAILELVDYGAFAPLVGDTFNLLYADGGIALDPAVLLVGSGALAGYGFSAQVLEGITFGGGGSYSVLQVTTVSAVPEPATVGLVAGALTLAAAWTSRRRKRCS